MKEDVAVVVVRLRVRGNAAPERLGKELVAAIREAMGASPFFEVDEVSGEPEVDEENDNTTYGFITRAELVSVRRASPEDGDA